MSKGRHDILRVCIPRSSHSRFPGHLTRGSKISGFFFVKHSGKSGTSVFWIPETKIKFLFIYFLYDQYFLYKPSFPSSKPSKTLKIESAISKSTGGPTYSSFGPPGSCFSPDWSPNLTNI